MKRSCLLFCVIVACCFLINKPAATSVSAQKESDRPANAGDRALAATIRGFSEAPANGIVERGSPNGSRIVDVTGGLQNVILSKLDEDGDLAVGCVANLDQANAFFGRDQQTGEKILGAPSVPKYFEEAARHGMSPREYQFYTDVIEKWRASNDSPASSTITIVNGDSGGEGFNDATPAFLVGEGGNMGTTKGQQRLNLFQAAADVWDGFLDSSISIPINSQFNGLACTPTSAVLGSAGSNFYSAGHAGATLPNTWYPIALANKQAGFNHVGGNANINATFNVNIDAGCFSGATRWYYGLDNATPADKINLFVVLLHEMGHGLGFATRINSATGAEASSLDDVYATFAFDEDVSQYWSAMATDAIRLTSIQNTNDVLWDGANVKIASGYLTAGRNPANGRVELYTPSPIEPGSSMSHFNTDCTPSLLMEPFITAGLPLDLDLTKQQMRDIGWFRDETADVLPDTITGISLSGSAIIGSNRTISWTNNGGFARNVTIELSTDGGLTFPTTVASNITNTGSFNWTVPNMPTTTAQLRVREHDFVAPMGSSASNFSIQVVSAASVAVSGRVVDIGGNGIAKAIVSLTDANGETRIALTNSFGYFRFEDVPSGADYVAAVRHKRFNFAPRVVSIVDGVSELDFTPVP